MLQEENRLSQFNIVKPWEADLEEPELRWANYFLQDRQIPDFVFSKPSSILESRIEFLITQFCTKSRRWVICFCDSTTYIRTLNAYILATFVCTTKLPAEIIGPKELVEFTFNKHTDEFIQSPPIQVCSLLIFPTFDFMYPGFMKARPKVIELITDRKIKKMPFMFSIFSPKLPTSSKDIPKNAEQLTDFFGEQARDLFSDTTVKFLIIKGE